MVLKSQKEFIEERGWDVLVVLDACRYDCFKNVYEGFFAGRLEPAISEGSVTVEWLIKTFKGSFKDTVYVSANPYVNSGAPVRHIGFSEAFYASKHFFRVVEVWRIKWSDRLGTVHPLDVTMEALKSYGKFKGKRLIVHYMQPHAPYIADRGMGFRRPSHSKRVVDAGSVFKIERLENWDSRMLDFYEFVESGLAYALTRVFDLNFNFKSRVRRLLMLPPAGPIDAYSRTRGNGSLGRAYLSNLVIVLKYVSILVREILRVDSGARIVVTSDHGEFLGEGGSFGHWAKSKRAILRLVPWFIVRNVTAKVGESIDLLVRKMLAMKELRSIEGRVR